MQAYEKSSEKASSWLQSNNIDQNFKKLIENLIVNKNKDLLTKCFNSDLSFGTGGIRALTGVGSCRLNIYTIRKISETLVEHLKTKFSQKISVAISYDTEYTLLILLKLAHKYWQTKVLKSILLRQHPLLLFYLSLLKNINVKLVYVSLQVTIPQHITDLNSTIVKVDK